MTITPDEWAAKIKAANEQMYAEMNQMLYGDDPPWLAKLKPRPTVRERLSDFWWRARNAWDVLRGRADIG